METAMQTHARREHDRTLHDSAVQGRTERARLRAINRNATATLPHKPDKEFVAKFLEKNRMENRRRLYRALLRTDALA
jgi:hypothetical protein